MRNLGIYIHIPFCVSKCFYCDFCSSDNNSNIDKYIDALCSEILSNLELLQEYKIDTIYFGGGTPSYIPTKYIEKILSILNVTSDTKEITIEANPETLTLEKLKAYKEMGINRLSLGLQSANNKTLKAIGRKSTLEDFERAYNMAVDVGFCNISTDVIIGLPNESIEDFKYTLEYTLSKDKITHISAYSLEVHENTKLNFLLENNYLTLPTEATERDMKYLLDDVLSKYNFERYEISNYAKATNYSKHNLKYWNQEEYLGFGVASASYINSVRYTNTKDINKYIENISCGTSIKEEIEEMDKLDTIKEYVILRLRLKDGVIFEDFKYKFKQDIFSLFKDEINKLEKEKLICVTTKNMYLTDKGEDLANIVWQEFI